MYAELAARSNYSFLRGASHPEELVARAAELGLWALALTDDDGLYGVVKAHLEAKQRALKLLVASAFTVLDGPEVILYAQDLHGYQNLCELVSRARLSRPKGEAGLCFEAIAERAQGLLALVPFPDEVERVGRVAEAFPGRCYLGLLRALEVEDGERLTRARRIGKALELPIVAHNHVHTHVRARQPLQDVMTAIRHGTTVARAGRLLFPNAERSLKGPEEMAALFSDFPEAVGRTLEVAQSCAFSLDELHYGFSREEVPQGRAPDDWLAELVERGLHRRYPGGVPEAVRAQIAKELTLIAALDYAGYFLALWDIVRFARERGILCQGRGSAANSAVCYALEITAIDPVRMGLLFERFLSMERREPPDIDVDFEHNRREEVLQYVYQKHGRHRAAMVCEHICFRDRLAVREVGKALGLSLDQVDRLAKSLGMAEGVGRYQLAQAGLSPNELAVQQTVTLAKELTGMPRHLSIHVGGFVITHEPLVRLAPVENAAMEGRTVVQWEKDDLSALNILKVDLLGLGMLAVLSRCFLLIEATTGQRWTMATVPAEDPAVYDMLCEADAIGTFQVESRAQQNMLPRLKPRCFYDLVVEIAIIRPGPIVGDMVHPYLRRRNGEEAVTYPSEAVRGILERTLGVPLFQEQAMKLAMVAAGFSAGEADRLRRAMTHKRADELLVGFRDRFIEGAVSRGYQRTFAENCFNQFKGFSHYGFPESHSASFALIAYVSAWLKRYHPAAFCAALLDSQPMGFYAPHTLVEDAKRHGVVVRPVDVNASGWQCRLELEDSAGDERSGAREGERVDLEGRASPERGRLRSARAESRAADLGPAAPSSTAEALAKAGELLVSADDLRGPEYGSPEEGAHSGQPERSRGPLDRVGASGGHQLAGSRTEDSRRGAADGRRSPGERSPPPPPRAPARAAAPPPALRLGLELIKGLREDSARRVEAARAQGPFTCVADVARRTRLPRHELTRLALAGALNGLCLNRRAALWELHALGPLDEGDLFFGLPMAADQPALPPMSQAERVTADYEAVGLSLEAHPVALLRAQLSGAGALTAAQLKQAPAGRTVRVGGLVIVRQRPPTAKGFTFMSVEDETGLANLVFEPKLFERYRREITSTALVLAEGRVERSGAVVNLKVAHVEQLLP